MAMFVVIGLTSMMMPDPPVNTTCSDQCAVLVPGVFSSHGVCMSACNTCLNPSTSAANEAVCLCHQIDDVIGWDNTPWKNMGACVNDIKAQINAGI